VGLFAVVASNDSTLQLVQPLAREAHIGLARPTSIESTDTTVLRAWLEHEVGYAVAIPSISEAEVVGATVAEMDGVRGAAVVYRYRGSALTYFDLPAAEPSRSWTGRAPVTSASADGYQVALWTEDGGARAVAAPMPRAEVVKVAKECREKAARAGS
jgi:anti-sigma factor RsiW